MPLLHLISIKLVFVPAWRECERNYKRSKQHLKVTGPFLHLISIKLVFVPAWRECKRNHKRSKNTQKSRGPSFI